jgi:nicotinamidase/pyrazinamidase
MPHSSLIVVDVQRDFCPGGSLAIDHGDEIVPLLNGVIEAFDRTGLPIYFTRDWHPPNHCSFKSQGGKWPAHCVRGTYGAEFHRDLLIPGRAMVIDKGTEPDRDAYSGFDGTDLSDRLRKSGVTEVFLGGLATDYCVKETVLDALRDGMLVNLMLDCVRGVDLRKGDSQDAIGTMASHGARITDSKEAIGVIEKRAAMKSSI